jgi:ligand-binding SRPBCC domain-containing protein
MIAVTVDTFIAASRERCFDLARDLKVHCETTAWTRERIVAGPDRLVETGDVVTFEGVHFGIRQRLTARIAAMDFPAMFRDEMVSGAFKSITHIHEFEPEGGGTRMRDTLLIVAPLGPLGWIAERLFLARYMRNFLTRRNAALKRIAEQA